MKKLPTHDYHDLIRLFKECFFEKYNTVLVNGGTEPLYLPADSRCSAHQIIFAHDYYNSALHEIAHWLLAGPARRLQEDYGYWYEPDGRTTEKQACFEAVEARVQALEWILAMATRQVFRVSIDNLNGIPTDTSPFKQAVHLHVLGYFEHGLSARARQFLNKLTDLYGTENKLVPENFLLESL